VAAWQRDSATARRRDGAANNLLLAVDADHVDERVHGDAVDPSYPRLSTSTTQAMGSPPCSRIASIDSRIVVPEVMMSSTT